MSATPHKWSYVFEERTRILVVDDDPILREFASVYLSAPLCQVVSAPDAIAALDILSREEFDIVLADIEMPGMSGFELVQRMRVDAKLRTVPVVMITCREDIISIDQAYTAGATSFTSKPINWRQLSYQLRYVIRASKTEQSAPRPHGEHDVAARVAMSSTTNDEIAAALTAIIDTAGRLAEHGAPDREAVHAREIVAVAKSALGKLRGTAEAADGGNSFTGVSQSRVA
jgi:DNA-binding response OmpR family regulator